MEELKNSVTKFFQSKKWIRIFSVLPLVFFSTLYAQELPYKNHDLPFEERVEDMVSRMTLEEKISQMSHLSPAIERLGIPEYGPYYDNPYRKISKKRKQEIEEEQKKRAWENLELWEGGCLFGGWWNEALHGVARAGDATSFPQVIGLGSTWNPELIREMASIISDEARIHNNVYGKKLTYWSPTINALRDPRWGRNEESYSEDPYLLSRFAVAFVQGMQGDHSKYLKTVATIKHFVANNSEFNRHTGNSDVSERLLREYYFPAFKASVKEGNAASLMGAYNRVNGVPACASEWLLTDVLREEWGFDGCVVSDCGAIIDIVERHKWETDHEKAVAKAVKAGCDLECETCGPEQFLYDRYLHDAVKKGYIEEEYIDLAAKRILLTRMRLGEFDPPEMVPYTGIPDTLLDCHMHRQKALEVARQSMVLLKNDNNTLPLSKDQWKSIAVIGPNANQTVLGGYSGHPVVRISPLEGIQNKVGKEKVKYAQGCNIADSSEVRKKHWDYIDWINDDQAIAEAANLAASSELAILVLGTNTRVASESHDRKDINLPGNQLELAKAVYDKNPNTIVVLVNGMQLAIEWLDGNIPAILEAWYPGQAGGHAIADVLFGDYNPGGKLPVTFYQSSDDLPPITQYDITKGFTYWFHDKEPLYPFGHGLSYTSFEYSSLEMPSELKAGEKMNVSVTVKNTGDRKGDEIVQLYVSDQEASIQVAKRKLQGFRRVPLEPNESRKITFTLKPEQFAFVNENGNWVVEPGRFTISIGGRQPEESERSNGQIQVANLELTGDKMVINH